MSLFRRSSKKNAEVQKAPSEDNTALGNVLVLLGVITREQLQHVLDYRDANKVDQTNIKLGTLLTQLGFCSEDHVQKALDVQKRLRSGDAANAAIDMLNASLDRFAEREDKMSLAIEARKAAQREKGESSGLWLVPPSLKAS